MKMLWEEHFSDMFDAIIEIIPYHYGD